MYIYLSSDCEKRLVQLFTAHAGGDLCRNRPPTFIRSLPDTRRQQCRRRTLCASRIGPFIHNDSIKANRAKRPVPVRPAGSAIPSAHSEPKSE